MPNTFFKSFFVLICNFLFLQAEQLTDSFRLDGYGNINLHKTEDPNRDKLTFSGGVQGRYQLTENISITGQMHLKEGENSSSRYSNSLEDYDSELKWLYIDYYLVNDITLRAGAFQFPVFKASETGDIGYTHTWTQNPLSSYGVFGCDDFQGVELLKNFSYEDFDFLAQLSFGKSQNILNDGRGDERRGDVDNLIGLTLKTTHEDFILNVGYLQAESTISSNNDFVQIDPNVDFSMYALETEIYLDEYTLKAGLIKTDLTNVFPETIRYYTSLEYMYEDFTPYILYSKEIVDFKDAPNNAPKRKPEVKKQAKEKYSLGLRYDYSSNVAFKASYTYEKDTLRYDDSSNNKNGSNVFMGSINVVF